MNSIRNEPRIQLSCFGGRPQRLGNGLERRESGILERREFACLRRKRFFPQLAFEFRLGRHRLPSKAGYVFTPSVLTIGSLGANSVGHVFEANSSSILYVDKDATGVADGTSWANALVDLAQALVSQQSFNEVWVAEGTYLPGTIKSTSSFFPRAFKCTVGLRATRPSGHNAT